MENNAVTEWQNAVRGELNNILSFWLKYGLDNDYGGFISRMNNDLEVDTTAPRGLIQNARILWTFARANRFDGGEKYLDVAQRAYDYLNKYFWDAEFGGMFWSLDRRGSPVDDKKRVYGQAFYIYGLAEYYMCTQFAPALERAREVFTLIEQYTCDTENGGYFETYNRDWTLADDLRLSDKDMNEAKSMNNHLHVLEAYTNLYRVCKEDIVERKLRELIQVFLDRIIDPRTAHFRLFFDPAWNSKTDRISFGHDIEGSWLLCEAVEVLGDRKLLKKVEKIAVKMAQAVYDEALEDDGSMVYEADIAGITEDFREFWPQAEGVVGFLNACQLSRKQYFFDAARGLWQYIDDHIIDKNKGEWFWRVLKDGTVDNNQPKISEWKGPYHNCRACIETITRLDHIKQKLGK